MFLPPASRTTMSGRSVAVRGADADLLVEVAAGAHPGQLDHPAQLHLAPPAAGLRPPQGGDQGLGLGPELIRALPGDRHLLGQRGVRPVAGRVGSRAAGPPPGPGSPAAARPGARPPPCCVSSSPAALALAALSRPSAISRNRCVLWSSAWRRQRLEPLGQLPVDQRGPLLGGPLDQRRPLLRGRGPARRPRGPGRSGPRWLPPAVPWPAGSRSAAPRATPRPEPDKQRDRVHIWSCSQPNGRQFPARHAVARAAHALRAGRGPTAAWATGRALDSPG